MSDLDGLIRDLSNAPAAVRKFVPKALEVTARNMKDSWRDAAEGPSGSHASRYPYAIDYDVSQPSGSRFEAEIGPSLGRGQGSLGLLEDAPGDVRSAPQNLRPQV